MDPLNEDVKTENVPKKVVTATGELFNARVLHPKNKKDIKVSTKNWEGIIGADRIASVEDWQHLLHACNSFLYIGYGSPFSYIDTSFLACLDLSGKIHFITTLFTVDRMWISSVVLTHS